jgi:transcriptional regulator with XRE-family HTH domain
MRKINNTTILTAAEVKLLSARLRELFGAEIVHHMDGLGVDIEANLTFMAVAAKCRAARESRGLSLKTAAQMFKVPQYRLRPIEEGHVNHIDGELLMGYVKALSIGAWFGKWAKRNPELYSRLTGNRQSTCRITPGSSGAPRRELTPRRHSAATGHL